MQVGCGEVGLVGVKSCVPSYDQVRFTTGRPFDHVSMLFFWVAGPSAQKQRTDLFYVICKHYDE
ncbi:MAG TPA: hypothetical protein PLV08_10245, partial [Flavobacteriales bacterium]|nr:hypothetical protein [Flavobacteriales bacterium]